MELPIPRRRFLSSAAGTLVGSSLVGTQSANAQIEELLLEAAIWLAEHVLAPLVVAYVADSLRKAPTVTAPNDGSFHDSFNPPVAFDTSFNPQPTRWEGYLGISRGLPSMCNTHTATKAGELNVAEINALRDNTNPYLYDASGLRLAPIPNSVRTYPTAWDLSVAGSDMRRYYQNPADYRVQYARNFCDCSGIALHGFHWSNVRVGRSGFRIVQIA